MDFRQIRYFMSVYEERSFTKASRKTSVAQPALSMQIQKLEAELGAILFTRTSRGTMPTPVAEKLYVRFRSITDEIAAARRDIEEGGRGSRVSGKIRVALPPSVSRGVLGKALSEYAERNPLVDVSISEGYSGTATQWVAEGAVDFAVGLRPALDANLVCQPIYSDQVVLMSSRPLNGPSFRPCELDRLRDLKLVLPSTRHSYASAVRNWMAETAVAPRRVMEIDGLAGCFEMARTSDWGVLCPAIALNNELHTTELFIYPVVRPRLQFVLHLIYDQRRPLSAPAEQFMKILEKELACAKAAWSELRSAHAGKERAALPVSRTGDARRPSVKVRAAVDHQRLAGDE
jgi:DNA-binding transcriptional LysR family regulator